MSGKAAQKKQENIASEGKSYLTGMRKRMIYMEGTVEERVALLVEALKSDGHDFTVGIDTQTPIMHAQRVVCVGRGIGDKKNMQLITALAEAAGAAVGATRPVAEHLMYVPMGRFIGMSGQRFRGNLYIGCGVSGAGQHLRGIKEASAIVAINSDPKAPIFKAADYGIVGDLLEVLPVLIQALDDGTPKKEAPAVKMKRTVAEPLKPPHMERFVCPGCGYAYIPEVGDKEDDVLPCTAFADVRGDWLCPECGEEKKNFIPEVRK